MINMEPGHTAIYLDDKPMVSGIKQIEADDFDSIEELRQAVRRQALPIIIASHAAWTKYESFITEPGE